MLLVLFNPQIGPLSGATTLGQSGPGSNGKEGVLRIPQSSSTAGTSPSDCLASYAGHSLGRSYPSAEVQSVYSTAPQYWAILRVKCQTVLFQIIQFSISTQFRRQKQFYFKQFSSALVHRLNVKTVVFSINTRFKCKNQYSERSTQFHRQDPYQVLPLRARVDQGVMAMKGYFTFPKAPALLEPHHQIVQCHIQDTRWGGVFPLCKEAVSVFYSPSRLGNLILGQFKIVSGQWCKKLVWGLVALENNGLTLNKYAFTFEV